VRRAQRGDRLAFDQLVADRLTGLFGSAKLIVRDALLAEDAVQDALLEAWRDLRGLRDPDRLDAWLHRLLVRACHRAASKRRRLRVAEVPIVFDHDARAPDDFDPIVTRADLDRAFAHLALHHRTILVLSSYADLSTVDVATALDLPVGTVKSRLSRAVSAFRAAAAAEERRVARPTRIA